MKKIKFLSILVLVILLACSTAAQQKLSLEGAIQMALHQNTALLKNTNSLTINEEAVKVAKAWMYPSLGVSGGFNWQNQKSEFGSNLDNRRWDLGLNGDITLFDGLASYANIHQKEAALSSAKYDLEKQKQDIILQTTNYYIAIVSAKRLLDFQKEDLNYNNALLTKIKQMYEIKSVAITDVFSQEAQTANSELSFIQAENNFQKAKIALQNYLALDVNDDYSFSLDEATVIDSNLVNSDFTQLFNYAISNRKDISSIKEKVTAAEQQLQIGKAGNLPKITGSYGISSSASAVDNLFTQHTFSLGVGFSLPIFSQFSTESAIETAQVQILNANE
ncbi:MAG: TolC family protein, partial [Ignavibacteria bacterium]|nr:TolC family protein [Ignavibacteria bacterium]